MTRAQAAVELVKWWIQFDALTRAEHLRRAYAPHHAVVRARIDVMYDHVLHMAPLLDALRTDWSLAFLPYAGPWTGASNHVQWNDWVFVTSEEGMRPFASHFIERADGPSALPIFYDSTRRCEGLCSEEQVVLHFEHAGMSTRPLVCNLTIRRIFHYAQGEGERGDEQTRYAQRMATLGTAPECLARRP
jgi:hypothetical protein